MVVVDQAVAEAPVAVGEITKFITKDGTVRATAVISTNVIQEMQAIHESFPVATAALGRAITAAALLSNALKEGGRMSLHFKGDGPLGQVFAEGDFDGAVRGFVVNPQVHLPSKNGKLNVGDAVGKGFLTVATSLPNSKQPYSGSVQIQTGEIGEDIAFYLFQSQQISSIVALGVFVEKDGSVSAAGGVLVQLMPGVSEKTISVLEERVKKIKPVTELLLSGSNVTDLVSEILEDFEFYKLDQSAVMKYSCNCNITRVENAILLLGRAEISALIEKNESSDVTCDFCGRKYCVGIKKLKELLHKSK